LVEGRLKLDTWEDPSGQSRSKHSVVADRVVFLSSSAEGDATSTTSSYSASRSPEQPVKAATKPKQEAAMPEPESALEKELFDQIESIKKKNQSKEVKAKESKPAVEFKDQPPFEDELPF